MNGKVLCPAFKTCHSDGAIHSADKQFLWRPFKGGVLEYSSFSGRAEKRIEAHLIKMWTEYKLCGQKSRYCFYHHYSPFLA